MRCRQEFYISYMLHMSKVNVVRGIHDGTNERILLSNPIKKHDHSTAELTTMSSLNGHSWVVILWSYSSSHMLCPKIADKTHVY